MITSKGLWYTAAVLGTLSVGGYLGREYEKRTYKASGPGSSVVPSAEVATLRVENHQLKSELAASRQRAPANLTPIEEKATTRTPPPDQLRVLADLQKRRMATMNMEFVDRQGNLTPAFVELFALAPSEKAALQQAIDRAQDRLAELERASATVTRDPNGSIVISVNPFPEAGGAAYDQFVKSFADTLGPERHAAFLTLGIQQVERSLAQFGAGQRTVTIAETPGPNGTIGYRVTDAQKQPQGHSSGTSQFRSYQEARKHLGTLERILPPDSLPHPATPK